MGKIGSTLALWPFTPTQISSWVTILTDSVCTETNLIFAWGHIFTDVVKFPSEISQRGGPW